MKRMICFISQQLLANFIPINETATRPDALHAVYTPSEPVMQERWRLLKSVLARKFPSVELHDVEVASAYDAKDIEQKCARLIQGHHTDAWSLNMTGGTKLMSAPAVDVFRRQRLPIYYVETPSEQTIEISDDWAVKKYPFASAIDLETYFELFGRTVKSGDPKPGLEAEVYRQLKRLDWEVWADVCIFDTDRSASNQRTRHEPMAEYDAIGISFYQLFAFEIKRLTITKEAVEKRRVPAASLKRTKDDIRFDLYKLSQIQQSFGGPFGKSYWVFTGEADLSEVNQARIKEFRIRLIRGTEVREIDRLPEKFNLPKRKQR